jgi:2'-5' RNA ligase
VVALGVTPAAELAALAAQVERGAVAAGFPAEPRPFRAHVTLGRARGDRRIALAEAVTGSVTAAGDAWDVTEIVLFRSDHPDRSSLGGARYTPLARVPLHP